MDERQAAAAICGATPLVPQRIEPIGDGWSSWVFEVDREWIFRFPRTDEVASGVGREEDLLTTLAGHVDFELPTPEWSGEWGGRPFFGYRKIIGRPLTVADVEITPGLADQLASMVGQIHTFDVGLAKEILGAEGTTGAWHGRYETLQIVAVERVAPLLATDDRSRFDLAFSRFLNAGFGDVSTLVHGDLGCGHILLADDGLMGVIDFGEATVGDPAIDFVGFWITLGPEFTRELIDLYPGPVDAEFLQRVKAYSWLGALEAALYGLEHHEPELVDSAIVNLGWRLGDR